MADELDKERLIVLETKFELLASSFNTAVERLERKLDHREENYVTKAVLALELQQRDREIDNLKESKKDNKYILPSWIQAAIALIAVIVSLYAILK